MRSTVCPLHDGGATIMKAMNSGISNVPRWMPLAALSPTPKHMTAIRPAPDTGTAPDTIATGVSAVSNPTLSHPTARPPSTRLISPVSTPHIAHDAADHWSLTRPNTTTGTKLITITATLITTRRTST